MAQGSATRLSPGTWGRTKGVWPMVGKAMIRRIIDDLYHPQGFTDVSIKTALFQDQIKTLLQQAALPAGMTLTFCEGEESDKYLDTTNTAHGALLAYKQRYGIDNLAERVGLKPGPALKAIAGERFSELKKKLKKGIISDAEKEEFEALIEAAAKEIEKIRPLHKSNAGFQPFVVTGVDCLTTANLVRLSDFYLQESNGVHHPDALAAILVKEFPLEAREQVKNYGVVLMPDKLIMGFEEKSSNPKEHMKVREGDTVRSYLVNPQLYYFDPAVLAIVELLVKFGKEENFSPDWGGDILPILAKSGKLLGKIMGEEEYWNDVGDYGTFLVTAQDILGKRVPGIPVPGNEEKNGWNNGALLRGDPLVEGSFYLGPGASIEPGARIRDSVIEAGAAIAGKVAGSVILEGARIPPQAEIINSIIHEDVVLPNVPIRIDREIIISLNHGGGSLILRTKIPYQVDPETGERLPKNEKPEMPVRAYFPNR